MKEEKWTGSAESVAYRPQRGFFAGLLALCAFMVLVAGFFFWYIPTVGLKSIHPALPYVMGALFLATGLFVAAGAMLMTFSILNGKTTFLSSRFRGLLVKFFLPLMVMVGGLLRIPKIRIEKAFIDINNQMVRSLGKSIRPERLLVLMPHCIQYDNCRIKITKDVRNCVSCGMCEIADLLKLSDRYGVNLFVSSGGTIARKKVMDLRPDAVVAIACERDLTSGIQDAYPMPVLAIVNRRPNGYCMETGVAVEEVTRAITDLLGEPVVG